MRTVLLLATIIALTACGGRSKKADSVDQPQISVAAVNKDSVKATLKMDEKLGVLVERSYQGVLPAADGPGIRYEVTLWNQEQSGDGVFVMSMTYIEALEDGTDDTYESHGTWTTLRGDAHDTNATVYRLVPDHSYIGEENTNFLVDKDGESLTLLNSALERPDSNLNYTLTRVAK